MARRRLSASDQRHRHLSRCIGAAAGTMILIGCASAQPSERERVAEVFSAWSEAAGRGDEVAAGALRCRAPGDVPDFRDVIDETSRGFGVQEDPNIGIDGDTAVVDFTTDQGDAEGEMTDVFVHLVREGGEWKVCSVQQTAPGGVG
jgi:hypothetical protein